MSMGLLWLTHLEQTDTTSYHLSPIISIAVSYLESNHKRPGLLLRSQWWPNVRPAPRICRARRPTSSGTLPKCNTNPQTLHRNGLKHKPSKTASYWTEARTVKRCIAPDWNTNRQALHRTGLKHEPSTKYKDVTCAIKFICKLMRPDMEVLKAWY